MSVFSPDDNAEIAPDDGGTLKALYLEIFHSTVVRSFIVEATCAREMRLASRVSLSSVFFSRSSLFVLTCALPRAKRDKLREELR